MQKYMRISEVAEYCRVSKASIYNLIKDESFQPPVQLTEKSYVYVIQQIDNLVESKMVKNN